MTSPEPPAPPREQAQTVFAFGDDAGLATRLARALGAAFSPIEAHYFPDGESRVCANALGRNAILVRSLHQPNAKLVELVLAASALRDTGAGAITLVAPYLAYMRQDAAFRVGEAISQKVVGSLLARSFDRFVSVDPHLHRTSSLLDVFEGKPALTLTAGAAIASHIARRALAKTTFLIGPDEESRPWVAAVAQSLGFEWSTARKERHGDRSVTIALPAQMEVGGRPIIIVDDVISSGGTLRKLAGLLRSRGATSIEAYTTHALFSHADAEGLSSAGISTVYSCNSVPHFTNAIDIVPLLADGLAQWR